LMTELASSKEISKEFPDKGFGRKRGNYTLGVTGAKFSLK